MNQTNNQEIQTLKNRVDELENQINTLKQLILDSTKSSGHFILSGTDENFLYTKVGDE
jgi:cell division protein FtsB